MLAASVELFTQQIHFGYRHNSRWSHIQFLDASTRHVGCNFPGCSPAFDSVPRIPATSLTEKIWLTRWPISMNISLIYPQNAPSTAGWDDIRIADYLPTYIDNLSAGSTWYLFRQLDGFFLSQVLPAKGNFHIFHTTCLLWTILL